MAYDFPEAPVNGQKHPVPPVVDQPVYVWDGEKWTTDTSSIDSGALPSNMLPLMDGEATPGVTLEYARGDHVHLTDSTRAPINNPVFTGTLTAVNFVVTGNSHLVGIAAASLAASGDSTLAGVTAASMQVNANASFTGPINAAAATGGHLLGVHGGTNALGPLTIADANIVFYEGAAGNWNGIGTDTNGTMWIRTGLSGTPGAAIAIDTNQVVSFKEQPQTPTAAAGDNSAQLATTAFVQANAPAGNYLPLTGGTISGNLSIGPDLYSFRAGGTTGVIYLGNADHYLYWDGASYICGGGGAIVAGNGRLYGTGDFSNPAGNMRLAYVADYAQGIYNGLAEPYGGCVITGCSGTGSVSRTIRYRAMQILTTSWYTIGYA